jgi:hypothetical protein
MSGDSSTRGHGLRSTARQALGAAAVTAFAAASLVLASGLSAEPAAADLPLPVARVEPVVIVPDAPAPVIRTAASRQAERSEAERETPSSSRADDEDAEDTSTPEERGCGRDAVASGTFDPSCSEHQGYLDPGEAGGRAQTSGESQLEWACAQGLVPASDCD